jgi:Tol biopolymer transport system component
MKRTVIAGLALVAVLASAATEKKADTPEALLGAAIHQEEAEGNLEAAIAAYKTFLARHAGNQSLAAQAQFHLGVCYEKLGNSEARKAYERVVTDYADQQEVAKRAQARLAAMSVRAREGEAAAMITRRVWSGPEVSPVGSVSPDGRQLTFEHRDTGDLALRDLTTGRNRRLTNNGNWATAYAEGSTFSPDGKQIAYSWFTNTFYELRILPTSPPEGTKPRVLLSNEEFFYNQPCSWTPDGQHILAVLSRKDRTNQIAMVSMADGSVRILKSLEWRYPDGLSLSPDGRYIVYDVPMKKDSADRDIYLLSADGGREIPLVQHPAVDSAPVWTPDGQRVLFISDRTGNTGLWMIRVADGRPQGSPEPVKSDMGAFRPSGMTRDGSYYYEVNASSSEIHTVDIEPASGRITRPAEPAAEPCLRSPDRQYLACPEGKPAPGRLLTIVVRSVQAGGRRQIPTRLTFPAVFRWFPDSRSLLVVGGNYNVGLPISLHRFDVDTGGDLMKRTIMATYGSQAYGSLDGKKIYYAAYDSETKTGRIMVHDIATDTDSELYRTSPQKARVALSKDGQELAIVLADEATLSTSIHVMAANGGPAREVFRSRPEQAGVSGVEWTADDRYLLFVMAAEPGSKNVDVWRISVNGGSPQPLGLGPGYELIGAPILDPDGRTLAFSTRKKRWEVWVLKNFLPNLRAAR